VKLACADDTFRLLRPHGAALALIASLGVEGVDVFLAGNRSIVRPEDIRDDVADAAVRIGSDVRAAGLVVSDVFVIPWTDLETAAPNHPDATERARSRELFLDMLELAARLESPGLTILPGIEWPGCSDSFARAADELAWRAQQAHERGLRFSVEPHVGSIAPTPERALALVDAAPGLEVTLDYSHFVRQGLVAEDADVLAPHARHVHVRGASRARVQESVRRNTLDFERIVGVLRDTGYDGYLTLEYVWLEWEHCHECDNLSETILLRDRLRAALAGEPWSYPDVG
jgi:sugar phosphate isomerase/epimerase